MIKAYTPIRIEYTKDNGEVSTRTIIPTINIPQNIRAIDITLLSSGEQEYLTEQFAEYQQYVEAHFAKMFSFQDWVEHTSGETLGDDLPWRTFKQANTVVLG